MLGYPTHAQNIIQHEDLTEISGQTKNNCKSSMVNIYNYLYKEVLLFLYPLELKQTKN
jgi:hypothetical protein